MNLQNKSNQNQNGDRINQQTHADLDLLRRSWTQLSNSPRLPWTTRSLNPKISYHAILPKVTPKANCRLPFSPKTCVRRPLQCFLRRCLYYTRYSYSLQRDKTWSSALICFSAFLSSSCILNLAKRQYGGGSVELHCLYLNKATTYFPE